MNRVYHTLKPVYTASSKTLILGSMPSITSRALKKYYGHPQNRFWKVLSKVYEEEIIDWQEFIKEHDLALWDVLSSCEISSSSDSSIKNVEVNDIPALLAKTDIENVFLLGKSAYNLYNKYLLARTGIEGIYLPSPSSANAIKSLDDLTNDYRQIKEVTEATR